MSKLRLFGLCLVALACALAYVACAGSRQENAGTRQENTGIRPQAHAPLDLHASKEAVKCGDRAECAPGVPCRAGVCATTYYIDDTDNADDPFSAGCHWQFTDAACTLNKAFYKGDYCTDGTHLEEYTNPQCHTDPDRKSYDCDAECKKLGKIAGECVVVENACGDGNNSARCRCVEITRGEQPQPKQTQPQQEHKPN